MNVKEIIEKYLKENEFDGLWNQDNECGCIMEKDGIMPCIEYRYDCEPGYKLPGGEEADWIVGPEKEIGLKFISPLPEFSMEGGKNE